MGERDEELFARGDGDFKAMLFCLEIRGLDGGWNIKSGLLRSVMLLACRNVFDDGYRLF